MADQVHDAGLDDRLGEDGVDRLGEALQAVDDGDQDVGDAAVLQFVHDAEPELGALGLLDPDAENLVRAVRQDAERDVDGLVAHEVIVSDLDPDGVEEDQRVDRSAAGSAIRATSSRTASVMAETGPAHVVCQLRGIASSMASFSNFPRKSGLVAGPVPETRPKSMHGK